MTPARTEAARRRAARPLCRLCAAWVLGVWLAASGGAEGAERFEGFLEPFLTIQAAAPELGVVTEMLVRDGDPVSRGQPLAKLDDDLLQAQLVIAELQMQATGRLQAALAELTMHEQRWKKLVALEKQGQAYPDEVARARADKEAAEGRVLAEQEDRRLLEKQYEKLKLQIEKRIIRSPVKGVVAAVLKHAGEFVSPADPVVAKVVVLDPLRATFFLPRDQADKLRQGQDAVITLARPGLKAKGKVEHISPLTDAESGAVIVKVLLDNGEGALFSGERCFLEIP